MSDRVRLPADIELDDRLAFGLTARQLLILAATAATAYGVFLATASLLPVTARIVLAVPVAAIGALLALGRRDGQTGDQLALGALQFLRAPRRRVLAPEGLPDPVEGQPAERLGVLDLAVRSVADDGVVELAEGGFVVVLAATSTTFALRSPEEQEALVEAYGRFLNALVEPVAIAVRAQRVDLPAHAATITANADTLPHPALAQAARDHGEFLTGFGGPDGIGHRQILLVLRTHGREPDSARTTLTRRAREARELLREAGVHTEPLNQDAAGRVLAQALDPPGPPTGSHLTGAITTC
jgi:hypothetical protein